MKTVYKYIDVFSGAGGFSLGFHLTGRFKSLLAIDNFKPAALTYKTNFPHALVVNEDVKELDKELLTGIVKPDEIDVIIGSPPCEPFTGANPMRKKDPLDRLYSDPMGQLTLHFIRIVGYYRPKIFVMENVPAITEDGLRDALSIEFKRVGYEKIYFNALLAEDYETPSHRKRVFISNIPITPRKSSRRITVKEALSNLPEPGEAFPNHERPPDPPWRKLKRIHRLRWGDALIHYHGAEKPLPNMVKLNPNTIAPTVLGSSRFIHPFEDRFLTVREQARLMGFTDTFVFIGGRDEQYNMVGEAVPAPLAKAIAWYLAGKLDEEVT
ncbi:Cytosine-specific DNA methylase [Desulfurococcus amylolyticus 1221n]|uniref:DNA (cytosine-5-)-methyltransferase n=1 Tax=Desulfurococcus amylolyticus (strain DSM 18924 / JCM 16383 / VKM B-2413 / 1221n) TaxID=490899 RepID=B8D660_DESA1|nr:DNA cytosine methyltransferase [Desulfurococcus amylolyticus]ACL11591.1 Cytosine-specific DNA methylase [Desulfurococcus amylolyticus 1221n]